MVKYLSKPLAERQGGKFGALCLSEYLFFPQKLSTEVPSLSHL